MTLFTGSPYEKMMIQKPAGGKRDKSPPASFSPRCEGLPLSGAVPLYWVLYQKDRKRQIAGTLTMWIYNASYAIICK